MNLTDHLYLNRCLELASKGSSRVYPNPRVGSVIVYNDQIIGEGFHEFSGGPHGEVQAVRAVQHPDLLKQSTLYVNLEPCNHHGKTPPCTELILSCNIPRVVVGCLDPNPKVAGTGVARLRKAGVLVEVAEDPLPAIELNAPFFINQQQKRPYIVLKWAQSADGYIAGKAESGTPKQVAITGSQSQRIVHRLRSWHHAIMVGRNTAQIDNPRLNTRQYYGEHPIRIVTDRNCRLSSELNLMQAGQQTLILNGQVNRQSAHQHWYVPNSWEIETLIRELYEKLSISSILIEGGAQLLQQFITADCFDELYLFEGPESLGEGVTAPVLSPDVQFDSVQSLGSDRLSHLNRRRFTPFLASR